MSFDLALLQADARRIPLADATVQCVVTSPPYWGLRKYKGAQELVWPQCPRQGEPGGSGSGTDCRHEWTEETVSDKSNWETFVKTDGSTMKSAEQIAASSGFSRGTCLRCGAWRGGYGLEPTVEMYVAHTVEILREIRREFIRNAAADARTRRGGLVVWLIPHSMSCRFMVFRKGQNCGS